MYEPKYKKFGDPALRNGLVPLGNGVYAQVSPEDYERVMYYSWCLHTGGYAAGMTPGTKKHQFLHRFVVGCPDGMVVDHISGNKLDNRRENLRVCTQAQNHFNRHKLSSSNTTGYTGVRRVRNRFQAYYKTGRKMVHVGMYATAEEAARARDAAAAKVAGEFLTPNLPGAEPVAPRRMPRSSSFRGVTKTRSGWNARASVGGKIKNLGVFQTEQEAALAYVKCKS